MSREPPDPDEIRERILVDTPVLDRLQDSSLPFRGQRRDELLRRVRYQVKSRRTSSAISTRVSNITIGTFVEAIDSEARYILEENIEDFIENRMEDFDGPLRNNNEE